MPNHAMTVLLILLLVVFISGSLAATNQFARWYPEFAYIFREIIQDQCMEQYSTYLAAEDSPNRVTLSGGTPTNYLAQPVVDCILMHASEFIKSNMASAQVLLGLTPTMLAVLGPSTEETSVLFVVGRRPLLSLLIVAGSPEVFPMRSFEYKDPIGVLRERKGRLQPPQQTPFKQTFILASQYILTIMAIANVAHLSHQLGYQVVCNFAPHLTYLVELWAFFSLIIHTCGSIALMLRIDLKKESKPKNIFEWIKVQFKPLDQLEATNVQIAPEGYLFIILMWFTAMLTVCHVIFGTLVFSSMLFISVRDSIATIGRYMASVICCRIVLMFELAYLRASLNAVSQNNSEIELQYDHPASSSVNNTEIISTHTW